MKLWALVLCIGAAPALAAQQDGRFYFAAGDFRKAARAFEKAVAGRRDDASLHYWLGKSYARQAEISGPLSAARQARKARRNLERAVELEPRNSQYLRELFEFYVDSQEWFEGGLERAAALSERIEGADPAAHLALMDRIADSRREHRGGGWRIRQAILWTSGAVGRLVPLP
jgi:tetratricopeptide (TPR) repeat protein